MDNQSLAVAVQLLQQDVAKVFENRKGKQVEGEVDDAEIALHICQEELTACLSFLHDRRLAQSMSRAVQEDEHAIAAITQEENVAIDDRRMALGLEGGGQNVPRLQRRGRQELDEKTLQKLSQLNIDGSGDGDGDVEANGGRPVEPRSEADNSKSIAHGAPSEIARFDCTSCMESKVFFDIFEASCSHYYCQECIRSLYEQSFSDETLFPPRCCRQPISLSHARGFLGKELVQRFQEKLVEHNDPNRTYCSNPVCSIYLRPDIFELNIGKCSACEHSTCLLCKKSAHSGNCVDEKLEQAFLDLVRTEEWQQCFKCRSVVELRTGCYHITCRCGAQFCYLCGTEWKRCQCEQWDDNRLLERGQQLAARERRPGDGPPGRAVVHRIVTQLREQHQCNHSGRWERINGRHQCEESVRKTAGGRVKDRLAVAFSTGFVTAFALDVNFESL
ncbi:hypothetical protein AJ78_08260 [Emergomyces pasteurianus Ep9510]|uniref:RBR-type E3 ubiquitin transferase n=1 Tax=Emergomyces pasteurianus Ep9510 TaxID=1447872 RepID=A0A1J9P377_9EURO|nr:hypothetical protein AJ78_08260 [Emergomyces pasteurianus Ep9510]